MTFMVHARPGRRMEGLDRDTALRVEKVRLLLDYGAREFETHRQNHIIAFTGFFGAGLPRLARWFWSVYRPRTAFRLQP